MRVFFGVERHIVGVQGTMCNRIASSEPQWVVAKSEVNNEVILSFIGYGAVSLQFGELTTDSRGSTSRDQPGRQVGRDECCQGIVLHDRAGQEHQGIVLHDRADQAFMRRTCYWGSTTRDQPACQVGPDRCCQATVLHDCAGQALMKTGEARSLASNSFHEGFMKTGEVINPRCSENRGSADQHF